MSGTDSAAGNAIAPDLELRIKLRQLRRERGLAQRDLLGPLHLASHTAIVDYESGRRVPAPDIIEAYERFFGLPSGVLQGMRSRALAHRAGTEARATLAASTGRPGVPRQLPAAISHFAGRTTDLATLDALLEAGSGPSAVVISAIAGMGGVGKTALAVQWGHRVRHRFPDGDLYLNLRGFHPSGVPMAPAEALGLLLIALGVPGDRMPPSEEERAGLYRSLLAARRMLLLLDNAGDVAQVRPLLPGAPGCVVLVTSRNRLAGLVARDGAQRIMLDVLAADEAELLLRNTIGADRTSAEPQATTELAQRCGRHPLALRVAAERVAAGSPSIATVAAELGDRAERLAVLAAPEDEQSAVRAVFGWSYDRLTPPAARLFRLLGLHDGPDTPTAAAAALAGTSPQLLADPLAELVAAHLVTETALGRYGCHDLLQLYAADRVRESESETERRDAVRGLAGWYLHSACAARVALSPSLPPMHPEPVPLVHPPLTFDSAGSALEWFETERANLVAVTRLCESHALYGIGWQLPTAMYGFFDLRKHYADWLATHEVARRCAEQVDDREAQGRILCNIGNAYRPLRHDETAVDYYERALALFATVGYRQGEAKVYGNLGSSYDHLQRHDDAAKAHQRSLDIFREIGDRYGEALTLTNVGEMHQRLGRYQQSAEHHRLALAIFTEIGDDHGASRATSNLGAALAGLGDLRTALSLHERALAGYRAAGDRYEEANVLVGLATVHSGLDRPDEATRCLREALLRYEEIGDELAASTVRVRLER
jgi:tetratricopeptide (TPR) repeat protein/transcriptional regulator with XRE-family HTH domain